MTRSTKNPLSILANAAATLRSNEEKERKLGKRSDIDQNPASHTHSITPHIPVLPPLVLFEWFKFLAVAMMHEKDARYVKLGRTFRVLLQLLGPQPACLPVLQTGYTIITTNPKMLIVIVYRMVNDLTKIYENNTV